MVHIEGILAGLRTVKAGTESILQLAHNLIELNSLVQACIAFNERAQPVHIAIVALCHLLNFFDEKAIANRLCIEVLDWPLFLSS